MAGEFFCPNCGWPERQMEKAEPAYVPPLRCEHCYCVTVPGHVFAPVQHRQCCKCGDRRALGVPIA